MKTPRALEFPVMIKQVDQYLVFTVKDFNHTQVLEMPADGKLTPDFMKQVTAQIGKCWLKSQERIKIHLETKTPLPQPSKMRVVTKDLGRGPIKPMTVPQVAKFLGISENSVRRIPKDQLRPRKSKGGHRRYSVGAIKRYQELYAQIEISSKD